MPVSSLAVLFDLDGVLVDSRAPVTGAMNVALRAHGLPMRPPEDLERFIGPPLAHGFAELLDEPVESARVAAVVDTYRHHYAPASLAETRVVDGITAVLAGLVPLARLAVATSKPQQFTDPLLDALDLRRFFEVVCGPGAGVESVPKAETVAAALAGLGQISRAVMIGDRSFDVVGAHANGIPVIGVTWGIGDREELISAGADAIVDQPAELLPLLRQRWLHELDGSEATTGIEPV